MLRRLEYCNNCLTDKNIIFKLYWLYLKYRYRKLSLRLGLSIGLNVFDKGLSIAHIGNIIVNSGAKVGKNCRIHDCVCIGAENGSHVAATIGDNCFIATGAKVIGEITIGNNVAIGANAVVTKSFLENDITIAGVPAKKISNNNSYANLGKLLKEKNLV